MSKTKLNLRNSVNEIRFKDNNKKDYPAWEKIKLSDYGEFFKGTNYSKEDLIHEGENLILYGDLFTLYDGQIEQVINKTRRKAPNSFLAKYGDILFPASTTVDAFSLISPNVLLTESLIGGDVIVFRTSKINPVFLTHLIRSKLRFNFAKYAQGTTIFHIYPSRLGQIEFNCSVSKEEQEKIGSFLSVIDKLILLQENLIRVINDLINYYIFTLYSKEVSFKKQPLKENTTIEYYSYVKSGGTPDTNNPKYWNGDIPWFTPTEIGFKKHLSESNSYLTKEGLENSSASILPANSIMLTSRATIGEAAINLVPAATNQGFQNLVPKENTDLDFLFYLTKTIKKQLNKFSNGSTFSEFSKKTLLKIEVPNFSLKDQERIGSFLNLIDKIIEIEKIRIEKYKKIKKFYLKMIFSNKEN